MFISVQVLQTISDSSLAKLVYLNVMLPNQHGRKTSPGYVSQLVQLILTLIIILKDVWLYVHLLNCTTAIHLHICASLAAPLILSTTLIIQLKNV